VNRTLSPLLLLAPALCLWACSEGESMLAVGTLERDRLDLVAEASEPVIERPLEEGAFAAAGALLVKLDPIRLEAQVAQAASARARAAARLAELVRGPRQERIAEARARLQGAEGRLLTARSDRTRAQELMAGGVASQEQLDQRRAVFDEALAARDAARATLDELLGGTTEEELAQAEAALAEADALLADARVRLSRLEVRAPTAGWLDALPFELGERPPAGGVVAVLLADAAPYARVYVPAAIRVHVKPGATARVRVDGIAEPLRGRVRTVASDASFTPYFALTERDRGRLVYLSKVNLVGPEARGLPTGLPVEVEFDVDVPKGETDDVRTSD
jgi:HlyD family secretion protein